MTEERPLDPTTPVTDGARPVANGAADESTVAASAPTADTTAPAPAPASAPIASPTPPPAPDDAQPSEPEAPTGAPVIAAAPAQTTTPQAPPPVGSTPTPATPTAEKPKRKVWPWVLALCIVVGLIFIGAIAACSSFVINTAVQSVQRQAQTHSYDYDRSDLYNYDSQDGLWNYYFGGQGATFDDLLAAFNVEAGDASGTEHARGAYRVGGSDGIAPGLYYLAGTQTGVSNFYVFESDRENGQTVYDLQVSVEYFGNYYTELEEGDCIVYVPQGDDDTFHKATAQPMDVSAPYQSGCYRVGIDIPAGTYTITANTEEARTTDSESGAFVMDDLEFDDDSIIDSVYVIKGGRQTITVKDGDYLELFAAIATPTDASSAAPRRSEEPSEPGYSLYGHHDEGGRTYGA